MNLIISCLIYPLRRLVALRSWRHGPNSPRSRSPSSDDTTVVTGALVYPTSKPFQSDGSPSTRSSSPPRSPDPAKDLAEQLRKARVEDFRGNFYIPKQTIDELIEENTVTDILAQHIEDRMTLQQTVGEICAGGKALFASLLLVGKVAEMELFFQEGIFDEQLPLGRCDGDNEFKLLLDDGNQVMTTGHWESKHREEFYSIQWWFLVTCFENLEHYDLSNNASLPTVPLLPEESHPLPLPSLSSQVFFVRFHPGQIKWTNVVDLESQGPLCAVKCLDQSETNEFKREQQILVQLTPKNHTHLIKLLSTFRKDGKWHLIFPFADSNLREYWKGPEGDFDFIPDFDRDTVIWSLTQMAGIADALAMVHKHTYTVNVTDHGQMDLVNGTTPEEKRYETLYGRHGDIKPENLLWFQHAVGIEDPRGVLQLADFGLGRLHGQYNSQRQTLASDMPCSPTYEPPEYRIGEFVTQAYDMWSLGCVLLEFAIWLVLGSKAIHDFASCRGRYSRYCPRSLVDDDDNFYTILSDTEAIVRPTVSSWVDQLHRHTRSSQLIHDLLDLITKRLIVTEPSDRMKSKELYEELTKLLNEAKKNDDYALTPIPLQ